MPVPTAAAVRPRRSPGALRSAARRALTAPDQPPAAWLSGPTLPQRLDAARRELAAATDDFRRLEIRDGARALKAAAEVLDRGDVAVLAAELVADCERAIARSSPPRPGARTDLQPRAPREQGSGTAAVDAKVVSKMRAAHMLDDRTYEALKASHRQRGVPITRAALLARRRRTAGARPRTRATQSPAGTEARASIEAVIGMLQAVHAAGDGRRALETARRAAAVLSEALALLPAGAARR